MIEIDNVSFSYTKEKNTLEDIDLTIPQGELILLCGESGCGKPRGFPRRSLLTSWCMKNNKAGRKAQMVL